MAIVFNSLERFITESSLRNFTFFAIFAKASIVIHIMKRIIARICCIVTALASGIHCLSAADKSIVILYENDTHGALDGYVVLDGLYNAIAKADTAYLGLVGNGDFVYGGRADGLASGENIRDIVNAMHYDAIGIGNHESDIDGEKLLALLGQFKAPVLCANLTDMEGNHLAGSYTIKQYGSKKVAFIGVLTPMGMRIQRASFYDSEGRQLYDLHDGRYISELVQKLVDEVRALGVDYVILLSHIGERNGNYLSTHLISQTQGIDAVIDGHSHSVIGNRTVSNKAGEPVPITQTGIKFANIGKLVISPEGNISTTLLPVSELSSYSSPTIREIVDKIGQ